MAKFPNITMTSAGLEMLARAASGQTADRFIVTKVKLGDGVSEGNIRDYTDVISSKKEVTLAAYEDKGNGTFRYTFTYNNEGVKVGFYHREIGLFAKNGDNGEEKLVGYTNAGNYAGYIDDETRIQPYTRLMINVGVGDTDNASGMVDVGNTVTIEMLDEHNNNKNAHDNLIKRLFGSATATMESVKTSVQNWCKESIASVFGVASATTDNIKSKVKEWALEKINEWIETLGIRYNIAQNGYICLGKLFGDAIIQWGVYGDSNNTLITLNLNITSSNILFAIATDVTNNGNPQGAYLGYDVIENNKIRFLFNAIPWTFAWFCISK
ncbi:Uncharacterised protein [Megamonas hypermegale]|uniref:Uncharacterized protein n=1 Tax=Megamonas hypermegale TaxID=158847 RepID=A0A378NUW9_9FIRM|nr:hypothetical protein [Megamonas hypermegale]STY71469.1 Uncharacterised protein [Megamonas hypermegale]